MSLHVPGSGCRDTGDMAGMAREHLCAQEGVKTSWKTYKARLSLCMGSAWLINKCLTNTEMERGGKELRGLAVPSSLRDADALSREHRKRTQLLLSPLACFLAPCDCQPAALPGEQAASRYAGSAGGEAAQRSVISPRPETAWAGS